MAQNAKLGPISTFMAATVMWTPGYQYSMNSEAWMSFYRTSNGMAAIARRA